jgi:Flp pilus assembly pilin Flp
MSDALLRMAIRVQTAVTDLRRRQDGQTFVEYGLIIAAIALLLIVALLFFKDQLADFFSDAGSSVQAPVGS